MTSTAALDTLPVTLLTGFLGSGKTTLLRRALSAPSFSDTAVIINEIGAIPIDHFLVDFVEGSVVELPGGCLCCMVREDLAQSLRSLIERRDAGEIRAFRRIAIETSGLADPAPILFTLGADPMLDHRLRLGRVVTVVDAIEGARTLDRFAEAARQTAVADALIISKTDLAPLSAALAERLDALNPGADRILGAGNTDPASILFAPESPFPAPRERVADAKRRPGEGASTAEDRPLTPTLSPGGGEGVLWGADAHVHSHGIAVFAIALDRAASRFDFARALAGWRATAATICCGSRASSSSPTAPADRRSCRRHNMRCSRRNGSTAGPTMIGAAVSSLSCMTSRPRKSSGISRSPRRG